jgi:hypothetical protein
MSATATLEPARQDALAASISAMKRWANYVLPPDLDRRILDLGERKESLSKEERDELLAWVDFTQKLTLERLSAEVALKRLRAVFPEIDERP